MEVANWTPEDTRRSDELWAEYQRTHDISAIIGKTVGIDPRSGRFWIGESIPDVVRMRNADGIDHLLFFVRAGSETYYRKGGRS